ncbi:hypothetical protein GDO86_015433 [Hymenochirus boettgeri]|uniref:Uncharacterized protein n=1 Tax=Hymenochirus boettgeri TaxID=247094 RepID=A0A8T2JSW9_9PIPI|nr:hypothetical protein GDO86_015433 [Hymenochirus boettgeri]
MKQRELEQTQADVWFMMCEVWFIETYTTCFGFKHPFSLLNLKHMLFIPVLIIYFFFLFDLNAFGQKHWGLLELALSALSGLLITLSTSI